MSRPLVVLTLFYILGILLSGFVPIPAFLWIFIFFICLLFVLILHFEYHKDISILIPCLFVLLGLLRFSQAEWIKQRRFYEWVRSGWENDLIVSGQIIDNPTLSANRISYVLDNIEIQSSEKPRPYKGKLLLNIRNPQNSHFLYGDRITIKGYSRAPDAPSNPDAFNYREYLFNRGVYGLIDARLTDIYLESYHKKFPLNLFFGIFRTASEMKYNLIQINKTFISAPYASLVNGMALGVQSEIPDDIKEIYLKGGIYHLLVVSGGNVMLVAFISFIILRLFRLNRRWAAAFTIPLIIFYALIVGRDPPVTRATIMGVIVLSGLSLKRDVQILNSLGLAALVILLLNPLALFDTSFQLSYLAVLGIVLIYPILTSLRKFRPRSVQNIFYSTISAILFVAPFLIQYFNLLSPISLITNLIAFPLVFLSLPVTFLTGIVYPISPAFSQIIANTNWFLLSALTGITKFLIQIPGAYFSVPSLPRWIIILYYIFLLAFIHGFNPVRDVPDYAFRKRLLYTALTCFVIWIFFPTSLFQSKELKVTFLDVGQGDCIVFQFPNGKTILVDGGGGEPADKGKQVVIPFLLRHGINRLAGVVMTHPDSDHVGGLVSVLKEIPVGWVLINGQKESTEHGYMQALKIVEDKKIPLHIAHRGELVNGFEPCRIEILNPPDPLFKDTSADDNNNSIVLRISYGVSQFLLTGDIQSEAEESIIQSGLPLNAKILKVAHHGSKTSSTDSFLQAVKPEFAVVQVGRFNLFDHPSFETLQRLRDNGILIRRTDVAGAVMAKTNAKTLTIESMAELRGETSYPRFQRGNLSTFRRPGILINR